MEESREKVKIWATASLLQLARERVVKAFGRARQGRGGRLLFLGRLGLKNATNIRSTLATVSRSVWEVLIVPVVKTWDPRCIPVPREDQGCPVFMPCGLAAPQPCLQLTWKFLS
jgi:hypothetical protein